MYDNTKGRKDNKGINYRIVNDKFNWKRTSYIERGSIESHKSYINLFLRYKTYPIHKHEHVYGNGFHVAAHV